MKKLDLKKYDVEWEYLDYDFKSLIGVCIIMPGFTFMIVDTFISIFSPFFVVRLDMLLWVVHSYFVKKSITFFSIRSAMLLVSSFTNFSPVMFSNNSM